MEEKHKAEIARHAVAMTSIVMEGAQGKRTARELTRLVSAELAQFLAAIEESVAGPSPLAPAALVLSGADRMRRYPRVYVAPGRVDVPALLDTLRGFAEEWDTDALHVGDEAGACMRQLAREVLVLVDEAEGHAPKPRGAT